jgi:hypothetical protein
MQNNPNNRRKTDINPISKLNYMDDNYEMEQNYNEPSNLMKKHSDNNLLNQNTMININSSYPQGIDFNKFLSNVGPQDATIHAISQSNDLPIIAEVK